MRGHGLQGTPQRWKCRRKASSQRTSGERNLLERDRSAYEPNARWVTDITYIRTDKH